MLWFLCAVERLNAVRVAPAMYAWLLHTAAKLFVLAAFVAFAEFWRDATFWPAVSALVGLWAVHSLVWPRSAVSSVE